MYKAVKTIAILAVSFTAFFSCTNLDEKSDSNTGTDTLQVIATDSLADKTTKTQDSSKLVTHKEIVKPKDYAAKYICPIPCPESGSDKPGECPNCDMELIENPNKKLPKEK